VKRPFHALATLGTAAHHTFELGAGVGLVLQPELGLPGSLALWATAVKGTPRSEGLLAFSSGAALGGVTVHYMLWPWERRRGVPWLTEAEGLNDKQLPYYNALLYAWGASALLALVRDTPPKARKWAALGLASTVALRRLAKYHFTWAHEQAKVNPQWWNRGLQ
jgi:hypothetical protein